MDIEQIRGITRRKRAELDKKKAELIALRTREAIQVAEQVTKENEYWRNRGSLTANTIAAMEIPRCEATIDIFAHKGESSAKVFFVDRTKEDDKIQREVLRIIANYFIERGFQAGEYADEDEGGARYGIFLLVSW